jgi:nicotinamide-nucleotide amidase
MLKSSVVPYLLSLSHSQLHSHDIHIFGLGESAVEAKFRVLMQELRNPTLAPYAHDGEVMLRVTAKANSSEEAEEMMSPILHIVQNVLGDTIYGIDTGSLEKTVAMLLNKNNNSIAIAESCTGGLIAKRLTDVPGVSKVFKGGVIAYNIESKCALLDIDEVLINEKSAVSQDVALAMADGARKKFNADIGVAVTGLAGPSSDASGAEVGTVFAALVTKDESFCRQLRLFHDRDRIRISAASHAFDMVRRFLMGLEVVI